MSEGPWIRFFPSDWLAGTRGMTAAETGIYITLIAMMYERGEPIPNDIGRLSRLCGTTTAALKNTLSVLCDEGKISIVDGGLWNDRVGVETEIRRDKSTSAQKSAETRWQKQKQNQGRKTANAVHPQSDRNANQKPDTRDQIESSDATASSSPEPAKAAPVAVSPAVIELPCVSGQPFTVSEADVAEWHEAFPAVDVRQQLAAARAWLNANPTRRKTQRGMRRFVVSWLDRQQNSSHAPPPHHRATAPPGRRMNAVEALASLRSRELENEQTGPIIDHRDAELLRPDEPKLRGFLGDLGSSLRWPDGSGHH